MRRTVLFRLDDICPSMNAQNFQRIQDLFHKYDIKPLLGIVPENKDEKLNYGEMDSDFWKTIKILEKEGWSLAMHGVNHVYDSKDAGLVSGRKKSEFSGHGYNKQYNKISIGKKILNGHGIDTNIFFAPGHSYDTNTIKALYKNGFRFISDGRSHDCYEKDGIRFIPCRKYGYDSSSSGIITICLHINSYSEKEFVELETFILANKAEIIAYSEILKREIKSSKYLMLLDEKLYVFYERNIRYAVSPYYQRLKKRIERGGKMPWKNR